MKNIFSFSEFLLNEEKAENVVEKPVEKKVEKPEDKKVVEKPEDKKVEKPEVEEKPTQPVGLTKHQEKKLPQHLKDAILKAQAKKAKK